MSKVLNPVTGYWITIGKGTYNKLIDKGYVLVDNNLVLKSFLPPPLPTLPIEIIIEEIIPHMMNPGHILSTCKVLREIYDKQPFWEKMYKHFFHMTHIKSQDNTYYEAYKICYNLYHVARSNYLIDKWYTSTDISWTGIVNNKRLIYSMSYMPKLEKIEFVIKNPNLWQNYDMAYYYKMLPNIKSITIKYDKEHVHPSGDEY